MTRTRAVVTSLIACALVMPASSTWERARVNLSRAARLRAADRIPPDDDTDRVYQRLAAALPPRGNVGVNVLDPRDDGRVRFRLQYALAPRHIVAGAGQSFVIESGPRDHAASLAHDTAFELVAASDDDVRVFRRIGP